ncbi:MAG: pentapeptide repeat-containing protein [Alistipes sp.]
MDRRTELLGSRSPLIRSMTRDERDRRRFVPRCGLASLDREHPVRGCLTLRAVPSRERVLARSQFSDVVSATAILERRLLGAVPPRRFADCKLREQFRETALNHLPFERCKGEFANFAFGCRVRFAGCRCMARFRDCRFERVEFAQCDLTQAEFGTAARTFFADSTSRHSRSRDRVVELKGLKIVLAGC